MIKVFTGKSPRRTSWKTPPEAIKGPVPKGFDTHIFCHLDRSILSRVRLCLFHSRMSGEDFHYQQSNGANLLIILTFYRNVDFSNLGYNSIWSSWIYDNPGYDTDTDGLRVCSMFVMRPMTRLAVLSIRRMIHCRPIHPD